MLVNCPDLFQTDEGASESQLCSLFHTLQSGSRASFLILDEIDMLAERSAVRKGVEAKVFTTLLKQIDDLNRNPSANKALCTEAALILVSKVANGERDAKLDLASFMHALKSVRPSGMGEFQTKTPDVHFSDLYGLESAIMDLKVSVVEPFQQPGKYFDLGIAPPRGVLIHGPPGVGKTMLCCALAQELGINFMLVEGSQIRSKIVGESEQNIARMFAQAKANAPCILFIDQIDVLAPARGTTFSSENSGDRIVTSLLTEMDGFFTGRAGSVVDVLVLAATNRPEVIDSAIMRPGRLDQIIHVPVPDEAVRLKILAGFLSKMPIKLDQEQIKTLAKDTDGFSGADLENLCRETALICLRENIHNGQVEWTHLQAAKRLIPPSLLHYKPAGVTFKR
ncbi:spermatogenesis associated protein 5 [Actinomortierella wolfii]|nr:spermatogenesis associated protein 5 [Actinomortierella wolfii]